MKHNRISRLVFNNRDLTSPQDIQNHAFAYYKSILGESGVKYDYLDPDFWSDINLLTTSEKTIS